MQTRPHRLASLALLFAAAAHAQTPADAPAARPEIRAVYADEPPRIDGRLDDALWQRIEPVTDFIQIWPDDGAPGTERSEARVAYDRDNLYVAFTFHDAEPALIRAKNLERGGRNDRDDHAYIALDTYRDGRNAYLFEMNALGTQDDATISDEGLTIDSFSWDAVFRSETVIDESGWTMEVAIPFRQLRFPEGEELEFGLMLSRMINRKNERVMWPRIGLEHGDSFGALAAVSQYGRLTGLRNLRRGRHIEIKPYAITGAQRRRADLAQEPLAASTTADAGVDLKVGLSSTLTLDLTVNTDFAQVEADNVQLNLDRFSLFFPEKREFFLERSGLFEHGNPRSTQTFFSRRIGLADQILAGARLTGQLGRFSGGLLAIETGDGMADLLGSRSATNTVARVRTNVLARGAAGVIATNVQDARGFNRALGADAQLRFGTQSEAAGWATVVRDTDPALNSAAGHAALTLRNDLLGLDAALTSVGRTYAPALGFVRRRDMRQAQGGVQYTPRVHLAALPVLRRIAAGASGSVITGQDGALQSTEAELGLRLDFQRRDRLGLEVQRQFERLDAPFEIRPDAVIAPGDYAFTGVELSGETDSSRRLFLLAAAARGGFYGGTRTDLGGTVGFRQSRHLVLEGSAEHAAVDLPVANGAFTATTLSLSVLAAVNRDLFARALVQYDNFSRDVQANLRVNWIHTPGSDLFFVFNTAAHLPGGPEVVFDPRATAVLRQQVAVLKLTYLVLL
jgi:hypothetical protein